MESAARKPRTVLRTTQAISVVALGAFVVHALFGIGGHRIDWVFNDFVYNGLVLVSALSCIVRGIRVPERRAAWLVLGVGLLCWTASEIYDSAYLSDLKNPPYPSLSDLLALLFYPAGWAALVLLVRGRMCGARLSLWLDGVVAALAVCTIGEVAAFHQVLAGGTGGESALQVATDLSYPIADVVTMAVVASVFALTAWRPGRAWTMIGAGLVFAAVADSIFAAQNAAGTYTVGSVLDAMWPAATLLMGFAAWERSDGRAEVQLEGWRVLILPVAFALPALGLLVFDHYIRVDGGAVALAALTLIAVIVRTAMTFGENMRMLRRTRRDALTDALTGLGNRRQLMQDLDEALTGPDRTANRALVLFDLDGFKRYNDDFGHPAGDALLARFGSSLMKAVSRDGRAYRLGGDEFCALVETDAPGAGRLVAAATAALSAAGRGFIVTASHGLVLMPEEAADATVAIHIADQRLYGHKHGRQATAATQQARDVLMQVLHERQPELRDHLHEVSLLSLAVGRRMSLSSDELSDIVRAAELHDIGKMAIPDQILDKPGDLDPGEVAFIRQHTIIGERILAAAPALASVAPIVRASHENWDGSGYPDGLKGEQIPLPSRIIAACDAYHAMTSDRPYQTAVTSDQAIVELRRCAGTRYSPEVIDVLCEEIAAGHVGDDVGDIDLGLPSVEVSGSNSAAGTGPEAPSAAAQRL